MKMRTMAQPRIFECAILDDGGTVFTDIGIVKAIRPPWAAELYAQQFANDGVFETPGSVVLVRDRDAGTIFAYQVSVEIEVKWSSENVTEDLDEFEIPAKWIQQTKEQTNE